MACEESRMAISEPFQGPFNFLKEIRVESIERGYRASQSCPGRMIAYVAIFWRIVPVGHDVSGQARNLLDDAQK